MNSLRNSIIGHEALFNAWSKLISKESLEGTFLFVGPSGIGKIKSTFAMIQQVLCEGELDQACGQCGSCLRVSQRQHESVLHIQAEGASIKVDQAHDVLHFCQLRSLSKKRFVIIEEAEKLRAATANILLKTLEEPPHGTVFILTAASTTSVLSTIRSRAKVFKFNPLSIEDMQKHQVGPDWAILASQGRMDRLTELVENQNFEFRKSWAHFLNQLLTSDDFLSQEAWKDLVKNREDLKMGLSFMLSMIRDASFLYWNEKDVLRNMDLRDDLKKLSQMPMEKLEVTFVKILELQKQQAFNKDAVLSFESLYIGLR